MKRDPHYLLAKALIQDSPHLRKSTIKSCIKLSGDVSGRQFFRVELSAGPHPSVVLIIHEAGKRRSFSGDNTKTQEESFVDLNRFLSDYEIQVPTLYLHNSQQHASLVEDVGDISLFKFTNRDGLPEEFEALSDTLSPDPIEILFNRAIDIIHSLQAIPYDQKYFCFNRVLSFEDYRREAHEFIEQIALAKEFKPSHIKVLESCFEALCETILSFPKALSHFDFTAFNLFLTKDGKLRVLDYQDAAYVSNARDLVSLINDRDMDSTLGSARQQRLISYYIEKFKDSKNRQSFNADSFRWHYSMTLLHWDFRVSGRFSKLAFKDKRTEYQKWLPGTLRRIGKTLAQSYKELHGFDDLIGVLSEKIPEVREGIEES